jgi:hypothetical protein
MNSSDCKHLYAAIVKMDKNSLVKQNLGDLYVSLFEQTKHCDHVLQMAEERREIREHMETRFGSLRTIFDSDKNGEQIVSDIMSGTTTPLEKKLATEATKDLSWRYDSYLKNRIPLSARLSITFNNTVHLICDCWKLFKERKLNL